MLNFVFMIRSIVFFDILNKSLFYSTVLFGFGPLLNCYADITSALSFLKKSMFSAIFRRGRSGLAI